MLTIFCKWLKIKDEKENVNSTNRQVARIKKDIDDNADKTIKVLNKTNKVLRRPDITDNFYLAIKE